MYAVLYWTENWILLHSTILVYCTLQSSIESKRRNTWWNHFSCVLNLVHCCKASIFFKSYSIFYCTLRSTSRTRDDNASRYLVCQQNANNSHPHQCFNFTITVSLFMSTVGWRPLSWTAKCSCLAMLEPILFTQFSYSIPPWSQLCSLTSSSVSC